MMTVMPGEGVDIDDGDDGHDVRGHGDHIDEDDDDDDDDDDDEDDDDDGDGDDVDDDDDDDGDDDTSALTLALALASSQCGRHNAMTAAERAARSAQILAKK